MPSGTVTRDTNGQAADNERLYGGLPTESVLTVPRVYTAVSVMHLYSMDVVLPRPSVTLASRLFEPRGL